METNDPRAILQLPKEERRARLQAQAAQGQHLYAPGSELISWTEEFVDDDIIDDDDLDDE